MKKICLFVFAAFAALAAGAQTLFSEGFENGFTAWTLYDSDGDGNEWTIVSTVDNYGIHGGDKCASSASYLGSALTPDNWMVSTQAIEIPSEGFTLQWYDAAQDAGYPSDHYSVYVAGTGNSVADFTASSAVFDVTLSTSDWTLRTVDMSAYSGQSVYIAFRHHDCTDMFVMKIDDIEIFKPNAAPEIALTSLDVPTTVDVSGAFSVGGVVTNNSSTALNSFKVQYSIDGTSSSVVTIDGLNVAYGQTAAFSHTVQAAIPTMGKHTLSVTVSEPNGVADSVGDNTLETKVAACAIVTEYPYTDSFDGFLGCWQTVDNASVGIAWMVSDGVGVGNGDAAVSLSRNPQTYAGLNQDSWLVSPAFQLPAEGSCIAKWFAKSYMSNYPDSYKVYVSTSNDVATIAASTELASYSPSETDFVEYSQSLESFAGQTVYIAFRHTDCTGYALILDDFSVSVISDSPEIKLSSLTLPSSVNEGEQFNVGGVVTNNSSATLNSFRVQYTVGGQASEVVTIDGLSLEYGETYAFVHSIPASLTTAGNYAVSVTVSSPNGVDDNVSDNTLAGSIAVCDTISSLPYSEGFENGLGCWTASSNNTENDENAGHGFGVDGTSMTAHGGSSCFHFSSYSTAADYTQFLVSPQFNLSDECQLRFYHKAYSENYTEKCLVMISSTDNDPSSFTILGDTVTASSEWTEATATIPAGTKYIAIKYAVNGAMWYLGIDDVMVYSGSTPQTFYTVTVRSDNPVMGTATGGGSFAENSSISISAVANEGYRFVRWNDDNSEAIRTITVAADATYTAYFEADGGTEDITTAESMNVKIFPNPTSGMLYVQAKGLVKIEVIDAVGHIVMSAGNTGQISLASLPNGIYSIRLFCLEGTVVRKVVKQ